MRLDGSFFKHPRPLYCRNLHIVYFLKLHPSRNIPAKRKKMMLIIKLLSGIALVGSIAWLFIEPNFEPLIAVITSLAALITSLFSSKREDDIQKQTQTVTEGSVGIQAGGDVNIGNISAIKGNKDAK